MENKSELIGLRVTPSQKAFLSKKAGELEGTLGAVLRGMIASNEYENERATAQLSPDELRMAANCGITALQYFNAKRQTEPAQVASGDSLTDDERQVALGTGLGVEAAAAFLTEKRAIRGEPAPEPAPPAPQIPAAAQPTVAAAQERARAAALEADRAARAADNAQEIVRLLEAAGSQAAYLRLKDGDDGE